jgi:hypothetical protein
VCVCVCVCVLAENVSVHLLWNDELLIRLMSTIKWRYGTHSVPVHLDVYVTGCIFHKCVPPTCAFYVIGT